MLLAWGGLWPGAGCWWPGRALAGRGCRRRLV